MIKQRSKLKILCLALLITAIVGEQVLPSNGLAKQPVKSQSVPSADLGTATSYSFSLWYKYHYKIPQPVDLSNPVNHPTAIAGVTENDSFMKEAQLGDRALAAFLRPFGAAGGPVVRFSTYTTSSDESVNIDIELDVDEVDGSWNFIYFGFNAETQQVTAAVKGSKSGLKTRTKFGVNHQVPSKLDFVAGSPGGAHTVNGYYFNIQFQYGKNSFVSGAEAIHNKFLSETAPHPPGIVKCDCGGPVMTSERDFANSDDGYFVEWVSGHDSPQEYSVYGWVKANAVST